MTNILCCIAASLFSFHENRTSEIIENHRSNPEDCALYGEMRSLCSNQDTYLIKTVFNQGFKKTALMKQPTNSEQNTTAFRAKSTTFHKKSPCFYGISSRLSG